MKIQKNDTKQIANHLSFSFFFPIYLFFCSTVCLLAIVLLGSLFSRLVVIYKQQNNNRRRTKRLNNGKEHYCTENWTMNEKKKRFFFFLLKSRRLILAARLDVCCSKAQWENIFFHLILTFTSFTRHTKPHFGFFFIKHTNNNNKVSNLCAESHY